MDKPTTGTDSFKIAMEDGRDSPPFESSSSSSSSSSPSFENDSAAPSWREVSEPGDFASRRARGASRGSRSVVCRFWLAGRCTKFDACEFLHEFVREKMPPCQFYREHGVCVTLDCQLRHLPKAASASRCARFDMGYCESGSNCERRHVQRTLCVDHAAGRCPRGARCELFHPRYEPPAPEAAAALARPSSAVRCHSCGEPGHVAGPCPSATKSAAAAAATSVGFRVPSSSGFVPSQRKSSQTLGRQRQRQTLEQVTCFKCMQKGHYANRCPKSGAGGFHAKDGRHF